MNAWFWLAAATAVMLQAVGASAAAAGAVYHVAQLHPAATDDNPGSADKPLKTISAAAKLLKPGDIILIETGVYRETVTVEASGEPAKPIRIEAAPAANVVVTGADLLTDLRREEGEHNVFSVPWPHVFIGWSESRTHPADRYHREIGRAEQVIVSGYQLKQVVDKARMSPGTFYVDEPGKRLYLWDRGDRNVAADRLDVEASVRDLCLVAKGTQVQVRGLRFRHAANKAQSGAVAMLGDYGLLEDCIVERMNSCGASFDGKGLVVRRCVFRDNGQLGFAAHADGMLMTECLCERNNTKDFARGWEAGGNKLVLCKDTVLEKSIFRDNYGVGIWFDIGNENCTVRNCLIMGNQDAGIFYEISYSLHAHDNVVIGNGLTRNFEAWGGNGGITLSSSPNCVVERNLLVANKEGFQYREQGRSTPRFGEDPGKQYPVWNHHNTLRNNCLAYNRDFQAGGWFDMPNAQAWPRAMQAKVLGKEPPPRPQWPAGTDVTRLDKFPEGLCLEDLALTHRENLYAARPGQQLLLWGTLWLAHELYSPAQAREALGLEQGSQVGEVVFKDWASLDLRAPKDSLVLRMKCYPQGDVPGVKLGAF